SLDRTPGLAAAAGIQTGSALVVEVAGARTPGSLGRTFADVAPGELVVYGDARGTLALAINGGSRPRGGRGGPPMTSSSCARDDARHAAHPPPHHGLDEPRCAGARARRGAARD